MDSSDICVVGEHLGYKWNRICDQIRNVGFYAEDGDGTIVHQRGEKTGSEVLDEIMNAIYEANPGVDEITIKN